MGLVSLLHVPEGLSIGRCGGAQLLPPLIGKSIDGQVVLSPPVPFMDKMEGNVWG